jgi:ERCC4-related helicase
MCQELRTTRQHMRDFIQGKPIPQICDGNVVELLKDTPVKQKEQQHVQPPPKPSQTTQNMPPAAADALAMAKPSVPSTAPSNSNMNHRKRSNPFFASHNDKNNSKENNNNHQRQQQQQPPHPNHIMANRKPAPTMPVRNPYASSKNTSNSSATATATATAGPRHVHVPPPPPAQQQVHHNVALPSTMAAPDPHLPTANINDAATTGPRKVNLPSSNQQHQTAAPPTGLRQVYAPPQPQHQVQVHQNAAPPSTSTTTNTTTVAPFQATAHHIATGPSNANSLSNQRRIPVTAPPPVAAGPPPAAAAPSRAKSTPFTLAKQQAIIPYTPGPVPLNLLAAQHWMYPVTDKYATRQYQLEMTQVALFHNTIVSLPTGLGKTLIAAVCMYNFYRWFPTGKVIFLAPTLPLVNQQVEACFDVMGIPERDTAVLTGKIKAKDRAILWQERRLLYCTPQTVQKDLESGTCADPSQIVCVVLDEAHKASGDYAYTKVIQFLQNYQNHRGESAKFRIIGLSATPGTTIKKIQAVVQALHISKLACREESDPSVAPYINKKEIEIVLVASNSIQKDVMTYLSGMLSPLFQRLRDANACSPRYYSNVSMGRYQVRLAKEEWEKNTGGQPPLLYGVFAAIDILVALRTEALSSLSLVRMKIHQLKNKSQRGILSTIVKGPEMAQLLDLVNNAMSGNSSSQGGELRYSPKLLKLTAILTEHFERQKVCGKSSRSIVFSQFRDSVSEIVGVLRQHAILKPRHFIGQGKQKKNKDKDAPDNSLKGMKQAEQQQAIQEFRNGKYNILVCTSIGEEGLDIGEVDLIINFDTLSSPTRMIQRTGRTGRKRDGRVVFLISEGAEHDRYRASKSAEKTLYRALKRSNAFTLIPNHPVLFPKLPTKQDMNMQPTASFRLSQVGGHVKRSRVGNGDTTVSSKRERPEWRVTSAQELERKELLGAVEDLPDQHDGFRSSLGRILLRGRLLGKSLSSDRIQVGRMAQALREIENFRGGMTVTHPITVGKSHRGESRIFQTLFPLEAGESELDWASRGERRRKRLDEVCQGGLSIVPSTTVSVPAPVMTEQETTVAKTTVPSADEPTSVVVTTTKQATVETMMPPPEPELEQTATNPQMYFPPRHEREMRQEAMQFPPLTTLQDDTVMQMDSQLLCRILVHPRPQIQSEAETSRHSDVPIRPPMAAEDKTSETFDPSIQVAHTAPRQDFVARDIANDVTATAVICLPTPPPSSSSSDEESESDDDSFTNEGKTNNIGANSGTGERKNISSIPQKALFASCAPVSEVALVGEARVDVGAGAGVECLPAADTSRSGIGETAIFPNSDEKPCCVPVDCQGEPDDPIGAAFMMRLPTQESSSSDDESGGSDEESISEYQQPNPADSPLNVTRIDAQAPLTGGTSDDDNSVPLISLKTKRNYVAGNGSEGVVCQDRPSSDSQIWDVTTAHLEIGAADSPPDEPAIDQELLRPQKTIQEDTSSEACRDVGLQKELVVPSKADTGKRRPRIAESLESVQPFVADGQLLPTSHPDLDTSTGPQSKNEAQSPSPTLTSSQVELSPEIVVARDNGKRPRRVLSEEEADLLALNQTERAHNGVLSIEQTPSPRDKISQLDELIDTPSASRHVSGEGSLKTPRMDWLTNTPETDLKRPNLLDIPPEDVICAVCHSGESPDVDPIVLCEGNCNLGFHQTCYSFSIDLSSNESWRCDACKERRNHSDSTDGAESMTEMKCSYCFKHDGPLKRTSPGSWHHPYCSDFASLQTKANCDSCSEKGAIRCLCCCAAAHPHCAFQDAQLGLWTFVRVESTWNKKEKHLAMFCSRHTEDANSFVSIHGETSNRDPELLKILVVQTSHPKRQKGRNQLKRLRQKEDRDESTMPVHNRRSPDDSRSEQVIGPDGAQVSSQENTKKRKLMNRRRALLVRRFIDEEAGIHSGDDADSDDEEDGIRQSEEEELSQSSFINDSLHLTQLSEDELARHDPDAVSQDGNFHRAFDSERERQHQFKTPVLNRRMKHRGQADNSWAQETPQSAPSSQKGLGNMNFIRSVLEHHRNGGRAEEIESFYHRIERDGMEENTIDQKVAVMPPPEPKIVINYCPSDSEDSDSQSQSSRSGSGDDERKPKSLSLEQRKKMEANRLEALRRRQALNGEIRDV